MKEFLRRHPLVLPVTVLLLATVTGLMLLTARVAISRRLQHLYLPWNVFLAWLSLPLALLVRRWDAQGKARGPILAASIAWLLFLPNAPYLLTDLVHLPARGQRHYFADMMLILHFALTGLMLGFISIHILHTVVERRFGWLKGWCFIGIVTALTGLGIYIGRFLRWNTWDVIVNPIGLTSDLWRWTLSLFDRPSELILPALFGSTTFLAYLMFSSLLRPSMVSAPGQLADQSFPAADARNELRNIPNSI